MYFFVPETAGRSLEAMDELFSLPWYLIGRKGNQLTKGHGSVAETLEKEGETVRTEKIGEEPKTV